MLTLAKEEAGYDLLSALPERLRGYLRELDLEGLAEIRLRSGSPVLLVYTDGIFFIDKRGRKSRDYAHSIYTTSLDISRGTELITRSSVYAYENEIRNGYITLSGGHRVGICGDAVTEGGSLSHLKSVQALNYRFAREIIGAADVVMGRILDGGRIKNTVIVSPPMCGKTTMLRDIARSLSLMGKKVSVVDERGEIAALSGGISPFDLGAGCDVLSNVKKSEGMLLMLRSMSPDVIITDEIGGRADFEAIEEIKKRGVSVITSLHGKEGIDSFEEIIRLGGIGKCLS